MTSTRYQRYIIDQEEFSEEDVVEYLSHIENFKTFPQALNDFIQQTCKCDDAYTYTKEKLLEKNIEFNRNTLKNWLKPEGKRPKKATDTRENLYKIAFALELTCKQTSLLFSRVYYDRPFDTRRIEEFVYAFSLSHHITYQESRKIIDEFKEGNNIGEYYTIHSESLYKKALALNSLDELKSYLSIHGHNFDFKMLSAKRVKEELLKIIKIKKEDIYYIENHIYDDHLSIMAKEYIHRYLQTLIDDHGKKEKNVSYTSDSFMLDTILGISFNKLRKDRKKLILKLPVLQEVKSRFPNKSIVSASNSVSYDAIRKLIILLASYIYWLRYELEDELCDLEDYISYIDSILDEANVQLLYPQNPYDWLFMYCTVSKEETPLSTFREIMAIIFFEEDF